MSQSLAALYVHLIFSTSERSPFLKDPKFRSEMHAYLAGASKGLGCPPITVGGVEDHIHILARLGKQVCVADWVREIKKSSTPWARDQATMFNAFSWQAGYGAFSTDATRLEQLRRYIENQEDHHRKHSFKDEFRAICQECDVELDERYAWD